MALTTWPSQRSDGRMVPAAVATTARQPRRTPSSAANGMAKRMATGKTHYLARDRRPDASLDRQPRADRHGVDRPRPFHHQPHHATPPAINLHAFEGGVVV